LISIKKKEGMDILNFSPRRKDENDEKYFIEGKGTKVELF
jgi:hypothetical protein